MAKNPNISNLDAGQVFKRTVDGEHDAIRVVQAFNTEMSIELKADKGDSVLSVPLIQIISEEDGIVNCEYLRRICKYGEGTVEVSADCHQFFPLSLNQLEVKEICAVMIRVKGCIVVGQS